MSEREWVPDVPEWDGDRRVSLHLTRAADAAQQAWCYGTRTERGWRWRTAMTAALVAAEAGEPTRMPLRGADGTATETRKEQDAREAVNVRIKERAAVRVERLFAGVRSRIEAQS